FLDDISLGIIAFAAGSEFYLSELRGRFRAILLVTAGNTLIVPILGTITIYLLADFIPFMQDLSSESRLAAALVAGAILIARSPSSAIAIVNELRAKGSFTQTVLGVTMLTDVLVITLFAVMLLVADALITKVGFNLLFVGLLLAELLTSLLLGYLLGRLLQLILWIHMPTLVKAALIMLAGFATFIFAAFVREYTHEHFPIEFFLEPLLICMVGSFVITNYSNYRAEFMKIIHDISPMIYVIFFTLTGASLSLDVLADTWQVAVVLFLIRMIGIFLGSYTGGLLASEPNEHRMLSWMTYITMAGVALGLAKGAAIEFPEWGNAFATMIISVVVVSQLIGPPLFKYAINRVGESHLRGQPHGFDGIRKVIIFGLEDQALAVARLLTTHGWEVTVASRSADKWPRLQEEDSAITIQAIPDLSVTSFEQLGAETTDAIIALLSNDENYQVCEIAYEHYGIEQMVVRLTDHEDYRRFQELGAFVVEPSLATVNLLDLFVRSPIATSLLLEMNKEQAVMELQVRNRHVRGRALRELRLPLDILVLSLRRGHSTLVSHGYTRLDLGDWLTVVGSPESLDKVKLQIEG
ncbi:MAG: cation:proton antiporter, partial [Caldilineaceae bacterium]|nr:cation:proton antiporter [Caldilineaceae bacterium]